MKYILRQAVALVGIILLPAFCFAQGSSGGIDEPTGSLIMYDLSNAINASPAWTEFLQSEGLTNFGIQPADFGWAVAQVVGTSHIAGVTGNQCYGINVNNSYSPSLTVKGFGFGVSITWNYTIDSNNQICLNYSLSLSYGVPAPTLTNTVRVGGNVSLVNGSATATTAQQDGFVVGDTSDNTQSNGTVQHVTLITILCQMGYVWNGVYYVVAWNEYTSIAWYSSGGGNKWNPPPGTLN